jgi:hypothetical protein
MEKAESNRSGSRVVFICRSRLGGLTARLYPPLVFGPSGGEGFLSSVRHLWLAYTGAAVFPTGRLSCPYLTYHGNHNSPVHPLPVRSLPFPFVPSPEGVARAGAPPAGVGRSRGEAVRVPGCPRNHRCNRTLPVPTASDRIGGVVVLLCRKKKVAHSEKSGAFGRGDPQRWAPQFPPSGSPLPTCRAAAAAAAAGHPHPLRRNGCRWIAHPLRRWAVLLFENDSHSF